MKFFGFFVNNSKTRKILGGEFCLFEQVHCRVYSCWRLTENPRAERGAKRVRIYSSSIKILEPKKLISKKSNKQ